MSPTPIRLALALGAALLTATPAAAWQAQPAPAAAGEIKVSKQAYKALKELETAVLANDTAAIPAKLAAAEPVLKTADDRFMFAQLKLKAVAGSGDEAAIAAAIEPVLASGMADADQVRRLTLSLAKIRFKANRFDEAAAGFERLAALEPANPEAWELLGEARAAQGRAADGVAMFQKAIAAQAAIAGKADERLYKRAFTIAHKAQLPVAFEVSRQRAVAYPGATAWRDAINNYRNQVKPQGRALLNLLRLARLTGSMNGDNDYGHYIYEAVEGGSAGEAKALMVEAAEAKIIDLAQKPFSEMDRDVRMAAAGESLGLAKKTAAALAGSDSAAVVAVADAHYGRGDYARAAELYRTALTKSGADSDLVNLQLGLALARQGDKAGATAALSSAGGAHQEIARFWLAYVSTL